MGRLTRHLDTTNGAECDVLLGLSRILAELRYVGYRPAVLTKPVKQVSRTATLDLKPIFRFIQGDPTGMKSWSRTYDFFVPRERNSNSQLLDLRRNILTGV